MSQSSITLRGVQNTHQFAVSSFDYHAALSSLYSLTVHCRLASVPDTLDEDLLNHPTACFSYGNANQTQARNIHGVIFQSQLIYDPSQKCYFLTLTLRPRLALLANSLVVQLYPNQSVQAIVTHLFDNATDYVGPLSYQLQLSNPRLTKPLPGLEIQYGDSDYDYLQHLCRYGLFFYFIQGDDAETVVITDQLESTPVHPESIQLDPHLRIKAHLDKPIFNGMSQTSAAQVYTAKARRYDPMQPDESVQQLTASVKGTAYTAEGLIFELADQEALNKTLTDSLNARQGVTELRGNYSALQVGERIRFQDQRQLVYTCDLIGKFSQGRWIFNTTVMIMPEGKVYYGTSPHYTKTPLPGHLYAAALQASEQVDPNGYFRAQMTGPLTTQNQANPDILLRDVQGTSTQAGGSSHSTTFGSELVLTTHNGQSADILIAGGLSNAKYPANITTHNEQDTALQNQGGLAVRLRRKRDNQPHAHIHMGVTDDSQALSFVRIGGHQEPGEAPQYGMQEGSTGFAKKVTGKHALKQVGQDVQNPVYKFQHQQTDAGTNDIQEQINTDSYSHRYYTTPLSGDEVPVVSSNRSVQPAKKEEYIYYIVKYDGTKTLLARGFVGEAVDILANVNLADGFEEDRWLPASYSLEDQSEDKIKAGKATYNRLQVRARNRAAWKGKYQPPQSTPVSDTNYNDQMSNETMIKSSVAGIAPGVINITLDISNVKLLEHRLTELQPKIKAMMPKVGGVLLMADYQVAEEDADQVEVILSELDPVGPATDFRPLIQKMLTEPFAIAQPVNKLHHWEFLFIWAEKE